MRAALVLLAACGAQPKAPARLVPAPAPAPAPAPLPKEQLFPAEVVQWDHGRETVLARTPTLDPTTWPKTTAGIWFVRPATEDLDTQELKQFVARATALGAPGISLAGERNADDDTLQPAMAPTLTFIDLSSTHITDRTVVALAALPQLRHVWLSSTPITDASLAAVANMPALVSLRIDGTPVSDAGIAALAAAPALVVLSAGSTAVTDAAIATVLAARPLTYLALPHTHVTGKAFAPLATRCNLAGIDLGDTRIDSATAQHILQACRTLADVDLARTPIRDVTGLRGLPLRRLDLSGTAVKNAVLDDIADDIELTWLDLSNTKIVAGKLPQLGKLRKLAHLGLGRLGVQREAIAWIASNASLHELNLSRASIGDEDARRLASLVLTQLVLSNTAVGDATIASLHLGELRVLDVSNTEVTRESLAPIAKAPALEQLFLGNTQIDGALDALTALRELRVLDLENLPVTDDALALLAATPKLEELNVDGTHIHGAALVTRLRGLPHLRSLGLERIDIDDGDLPGLAAAAPRLDTLTLADDPLTDAGLAALASLPLQQLSIESTAATDASCAGLARLTAVNVAHTRVTARCLTALSSSARELYAAGISVHDLELAADSKLEILWIDQLDARSFAALAHLPALQTLYLSGSVRSAWRRVLEAKGVTVVTTS